MNTFVPNFFTDISREFSAIQKKQIKLASLSRDILRLSKQIIFALHRDDTKAANAFIKKIEKLVAETQGIIAHDARLRNDGTYRAASEEYLEALFFNDFLADKKLDRVKNLDVSLEEYLAALADFTGELVRRAVLMASKREDANLAIYQKVIDELVSEMAKFHLTGRLRQKFDEAKRNLKRIEEILYDVNLRR